MKPIHQLLGIAIIPALFSCATTQSTAPQAFTLQPQATAHPRITKLRTYNSPGRSSEILSYHRGLGLLLASNSAEKVITFLSIPRLSSANPVPIDFDATAPGIQSMNLGGDPTSLAVHPNRNLALIPVNSDRGRLLTIDLDAAAKGQTTILTNQAIGIQLDSIAIAPNGKWAVIADEAEGSSSSPGNIVVADISSPSSGKSYPIYKVPNLAAALGAKQGRVEPEYVTIDKSSRFAAVSCQENDAIVLISLSATPSIQSVIKLPRNAEPDGIHLHTSRGQTLLAITEEGTDTVSLYSINTSNLKQSPRLLSRFSAAQLAGGGNRTDPEGAYIFEQSGVRHLAIAAERANSVLIMDISNPSQPKKLANVPVGSRPEGILAIKEGQQHIILSGDEGKPGSGEISFISIQ